MIIKYNDIIQRICKENDFDTYVTLYNEDFSSLTTSVYSDIGNEDVMNGLIYNSFRFKGNRIILIQLSW